MFRLRPVFIIRAALKNSLPGGIKQALLPLIFQLSIGRPYILHSHYGLLPTNPWPAVSQRHFLPLIFINSLPWPYLCVQNYGHLQKIYLPPVVRFLPAKAPQGAIKHIRSNTHQDPTFQRNTAISHAFERWRPFFLQHT